MPGHTLPAVQRKVPGRRSNRKLLTYVQIQKQYRRRREVNQRRDYGMPTIVQACTLPAHPIAVDPGT